MSILCVRFVDYACFVPEAFKQRKFIKDLKEKILLIDNVRPEAVSPLNSIFSFLKMKSYYHSEEQAEEERKYLREHQTWLDGIKSIVWPKKLSIVCVRGAPWNATLVE